MLPAPSDEHDFVFKIRAFLQVIRAMLAIPAIRAIQAIRAIRTIRAVRAIRAIRTIQAIGTIRGLVRLRAIPIRIDSDPHASDDSLASRLGTVSIRAIPIGRFS